MICNQCNAEVKDGDKFCTSCGAPTNTSSEKKSTEATRSDEIKIADVITIQDTLRKDIDFESPESELTPEQVAKKYVYMSMDKIVEEKLGIEVKKNIDDTRKQIESIFKLQTNFVKLVGIGKEIEKHFLVQCAYIINHFHKGKENHFRVVVDGMTNDAINKKMSNSDRIEFANKILEIIRGYREKVLNEVTVQQVIISSLIPTFERILAATDFELYAKELGDTNNAQEMKLKYGDWVNLSKDLLKHRAMAIEAIGEQLEMDEILPKHLIKANGDATQNISATAMKTKGERMIELLNEADKAEKEIEDKRGKISEGLYGKPETYMDILSNQTK